MPRRRQSGLFSRLYSERQYYADFPYTGFLLAALTALGLTAARPAIAQLLNGQPIHVTILDPNNSTLYQDRGTQTVTPAGVSFSNGTTSEKVTPTQVVAPLTNGTYAKSTFNGFEFSETGTPSQTITITSVVIDPATNFTEFNAADVTFDSHDIFVNVSGLSFNRQENVTLDITSSPVPEASTTVSLGLLLAHGLGGVMVAARKKKSA